MLFRAVNLGLYQGITPKTEKRMYLSIGKNCKVHSYML